MLVQRATDKSSPYALFHRHRLTRQHGLIDCRAAGNHRAVDRNTLTRSNRDLVAGLYLLPWQKNFVTTSPYPRECGLQRSQAAQRKCSFALRTRFQRVSGEHHADYKDRGFVIHVRR